MHTVDSQCVSHLSTTDYKGKCVLTSAWFSKKIESLDPTACKSRPYQKSNNHIKVWVETSTES